MAIAWVLFVPAADWLATHDVGHVTGTLQQTARDDARGRLLTLGAGLFAAGALIFTARNFTMSRRTFELAEQGQVTDRYTKAIEQLGSKNLTVRTGGIYALERVARDSARDQFTVMEVLAASIRDYSREQPPLPESGAVPLRAVPLHLQVALTVIGRRNPAITQRIDLARADLSGAILTGAGLGRADLSSTDLSGADLTGVDFASANLSAAKLADANLSPLIRGSSDAHLDFTPAQLTRAETPLSSFGSSPSPLTTFVRTSAARTSPARTSPTLTLPARSSSERNSRARSSPAHSCRQTRRFRRGGNETSTRDA